VDFNTFETMKFSPLVITVTLLFLMACRRDEVSLKELDLNTHGLPITILAPENPEVQEKDYGIMRDITVKKGDNYYLQIFEFDANTQDAAGEKLRQLASVRDTPFFMDVIKEDDHGFIYSTKLDSIGVDYDFRYVRILNDKELIFQTGLVGTFSLEDVKRMYNAVR
jgi:hypothetical protein